MRTLRAWLVRFASFFGKDNHKRDFASELESHLEMHVQDNLRAGMTPEQARREALMKLGGIEQTKEIYRDRRGVPFLETFLRDLRFALRVLRKSPLFTLVAVLTLALGIGANTAIFSAVNAIVLRPLPFPDPDRLMVVWHTPPQKSFPGVPTFLVSPANYTDWRNQSDVFERLVAIGFGNSNLTGMGEPESVTGVSVSSDFFSLLRIQPALGRAFLPEEDQPGHGNVVVISHAFWQNHFGSHQNVLGQSVKLDDRNYVVIGVMPPKFDFPFQAQLWKPLAWTEKESAVRGIHNFLVLARLKRGVSRATAQVQMDTICSRLALQYPADDAGWGASVLPLGDQLIGPVRPALFVLLGAVGFVLLIACTNVANLTLAKAVGRRKEIAIRTVLGASRWRVVTQVLSETLLLSLFGGALALLLARFVIAAIASYLVPQLALSVDIGLDGWVLGFTLAISVLTGIVAGLGPSWHLTKTNLNASLKQGLGKTDSDSGGSRVRSVLVVVEVALSLVLLVGAGLMIRTVHFLRSVNPGIDPHNVLTVPLSISKVKFATSTQENNFFENVLERVRALPGVECAGAVDALPLTGGSTQPVAVEGQPVVPMADQPEVAVRLITPGYLSAMRIPLKRGRDITSADAADSPKVILVSDSFAKRFWPHEDPIGKHLTLTFKPGVSREVVGVVGDVKLRQLAATRPEEAVYDVMAQNQETAAMVLAVRTTPPSSSLISAITEAVHRVDPSEPVVGAQTMETVVDQSIVQSRLSVILLSVFSLLALLLAAVGIYGVQAYAVRQQARELGIRIAMGAQRADVFRLVIGQGLKLAVIGICLGLAASFGLTRLMASQLYGLGATDPLTFIGVSLLLGLITLGACFIPSRRATRVDPIIALRYE